MSKLQANQYIGNGFSAYGGELEVLLTYQDNKIQDLQVTKHHESEMGQWALDELPGKIIAANSAEVDGVTGASATSRAIKDATIDALKKAQLKDNK
ncbi:FMN-binding protein [Limosilactobacillus sp. RRLNB_1_1]|uniref:FMN-binding protein n=1 Tax=Limosilactobacillus albertensis TaxID=2759752 RepID=A0A7W3TT46_9LACO|nr:FMN-binding protein [Limosilactobacillus albertensis]MBB1070402.1 FMN-binding protein [Limosilactobacillus albertensis]MBB1123984.1 FMN-binding protein [Limosilactobacillus albertensis]MCD7117544.1 FMN-binding protein [Limosilactobacillus albertensis]MCD7122880.1 FMN-binding protein [Limosilactobacillus albertensis]MCD7127892.1 FMN-binding protein [Limosilactobacillus albertensis]